MQAVADRSAGVVLAILGLESNHPRRHLFGRILLATVAASAIVPAMLSAVMAPSLALPAGFAFSGASGLLAGSLALARGPVAAEPIATQSHVDMSAYDMLPGLLVVLDDRGEFRSVHGRDADGLKACLAPFAGTLLVEALHVSDRLDFLAALDRLRQGEDQASADVRMPRDAASAAEDGQFVTIRISLSACRDEAGRIDFILADIVDHSQFAALSAEKAALAAGVQSAHATKTRFLAAVSHELRTPLNAILGFSDMLKSGYVGPLANGRQSEYVGLIHDSGQHLLAVVNSMLAMSKIEAGRYELIKEPFGLSEALRGVEDMMSLQARDKGVVLTARATRDLGEILADRRAVSQIMINLVGNAIKFTNAGGVVCVDCSRRGDDAVIVVSDTGIGIPLDRLSDIGQPFVQVQNELTRHYEGTGLGLSLVKGLVSLHGGTFKIESDEGKGTVVTITLPLDGGLPQHGQIEEFPPRLAFERVAQKAAVEVGHGSPAAKTA